MLIFKRDLYLKVTKVFVFFLKKNFHSARSDTVGFFLFKKIVPKKGVSKFAK